MTPDDAAPTTPSSPFDDRLGLVILEATADRCVVRLEVDPAVHAQPYGIVHGGVWCAMAETAASIGAALAAADLAEGAGAVGQSNHTDFLRATTGGTVTGTATPVHVGRSVQLWAVDMNDEEGRLVAQAKVRLFNVGVDRLPR